MESRIREDERPTSRTVRARVVLDQAIATAHEFGDGYVGTQHLLLGVMLESHGIAAQTLTAAGLSEPQLRREIVRLLQGEGVAALINVPQMNSDLQIPLSIAVEVHYGDGSTAKKIFTSKDEAIGFLRQIGRVATARLLHSLHRDLDRNEGSRQTKQSRPTEAEPQPRDGRFRVHETRRRIEIDGARFHHDHERYQRYRRHHQHQSAKGRRNLRGVLCVELGEERAIRARVRRWRTSSS